MMLLRGNRYGGVPPFPQYRRAIERADEQERFILSSPAHFLALYRTRFRALDVDRARAYLL